MNFRPLHDRVLVRRVEAEEKTAGGIIIPDTAQEKPQEGEVISVGSGNPPGAEGQLLNQDWAESRWAVRRGVTTKFAVKSVKCGPEIEEVGSATSCRSPTSDCSLFAEGMPADSRIPGPVLGWQAIPPCGKPCRGYPIVTAAALASVH